MYARRSEPAVYGGGGRSTASERPTPSPMVGSSLVYNLILSWLQTHASSSYSANAITPIAEREDWAGVE